MPGAFSIKSKAELKQMSLLDLNLYIADLKKRVQWLQGPARKVLEQSMAEAVQERDAKRAKA
jgi:hypothetical protein